jgi:hypothetical protein
VESDSLSKDEVGAIFSYLRRRLHYQLHCIIDTVGKSLMRGLMRRAARCLRTG